VKILRSVQCTEAGIDGSNSVYKTPFILHSVECYGYYCEWSNGNCMKGGCRGETGVSVSAAGVWS
jgi:hypothetical protein